MSFDRVDELVLLTLTRALLFVLIIPTFCEVLEAHTFRFISLILVVLTLPLCRMIDEHSAMSTGISILKKLRYFGSCIVHGIRYLL